MGGGVVAWVRVQGVADRPLHVAACYVPPNLPAAGLGQFFGRLHRDVLRAREAGTSAAMFSQDAEARRAGEVGAW